MPRTFRRAVLGRAVPLAAASMCATALLALPASALPASAATASAGKLSSFPAGARLFVPPPTAGAPQEIAQLLKSHDGKDAALLAEMEAIPRAVWFNGGTPAQVEQQVRQTMLEAAAEHAVPVLVAYDIPGRDCAQYSAGGALDQADYEAWISAFAQGIGTGAGGRHRGAGRAGQHALGLRAALLGRTRSPTPSGSPSSSTRSARWSQDPGTSVYLDGTHSAWQSVGTITQRLLEADVQDAQGFFLNVSNYQPTAELIDYGTWISDCIAMVTDPSNAFYGNPSACASQYYPATQSDFSTWGLTTAWYAAEHGQRRGQHALRDRHQPQRPGPEQHAAPTPARPTTSRPPSISTLASGNWCNPPGRRAGPAADHGHRRPAARRLPVGQDPRPVRRPVRCRGRRPGLGLHRLHPARLADARPRTRRCSTRCGASTTRRPAPGSRSRRCSSRSWPARHCPATEGAAGPASGAGPARRGRASPAPKVSGSGPPVFLPPAGMTRANAARPGSAPGRLGPPPRGT